MNWKLTGWEGINLSVPEDWELSSVDGNREKGTFSLDDGYSIRVEVEWEYPKSTFSMEKLIEKYRQEIIKKGKNIKCNIVKIKTNFFKGKSGAILHWKNHEEGYSTVSYCKKCGRVVFLRVYFPEKKHSKEIFLCILNSFSEHAEKGREIWAIYKLIFSAPENLKRISSSLKAGDITFTFQDEKGKGEITLSQIALGNIILRQQPLSAWTKERIGGKIIEEKQEERNNHAYFFFRYKKKAFSRTWENGISWYCPISQRIFLVTGNNASDLLKIYCHETK
ncbi:MAG: hypothetical protein GXO71_00305 [Caldiserica bacterium]|nr:hypothetical protein [Caldisericota bacterium]